MMQLNLHRNNLDSVVDGVHQLFEQWEQSSVLHSRVHEETLVCTRIVIHEWMANLIQHADFGGRTPAITIGVAFEDGRVRCFVRDNSVGFDLESHLSGDIEQCFSTLPERGMGLFMLQRCADQISYSKADEGEYELEFSVSAERGRFRTLYAMAN